MAVRPARTHAAVKRVRAVQRGHRIDPWTPMRGVVAHAYRGAVNLRMGGQLWSVVPEGVPDGPTTIRLPEREWPTAAGVAVGAPAVHRAGALAVGGIVIDVRAAPVWSPRPFPRRPAPGALGRAGRLAAAALAAGAAPWIPAALEAGLADPPRGVPPLVGRGIGLTPAGDDALTGGLAAAAALGEPVPDLAAAVLAASCATTDLAASFLRQACAGDFHRPLHEAMAAVVADRGATAATARLLAVGATSGADAALGAATALSRFLHRADPGSPIRGHPWQASPQPDDRAAA